MCYWLGNVFHINNVTLNLLMYEEEVRLLYVNNNNNNNIKMDLSFYLCYRHILFYLNGRNVHGRNVREWEYFNFKRKYLMYLLLLSRIYFSHFFARETLPISSVLGEMTPISRGETATLIKTEHRGPKAALSNKKRTHCPVKWILWNARKMEGNTWFNIHSF